MTQIPSLQRCTTAVGPIAYRRWGSGPPIILLHGWGGSSRYWMGAATTLAANYTVIAPDLPGFGSSAPPSAPTTLNSLTGSVLALADALDLDGFALGGHSLGAGVALLVAAHAPERVQKLVLVSFGLSRTPLEAAMMTGLHLQQQRAAMFWAPWLVFWRPWLAASQPWREWFWTQPPLAEALAQPMIMAAVPREMIVSGVGDLSRMDARVCWESAATNGDPQVLARTRDVQAPTLIINGRADPLFPPDSARALHAAIPHAILELLAECAHVPMAETPERLYGLMERFLRTEG